MRPKSQKENVRALATTIHPYRNLPSLLGPGAHLTGVEKAAMRFLWKLGFKSIDDVTWPESSVGVEEVSEHSHVNAIFNSSRSRQRKTFLFRAYYVPLFCRCLILWQSERSDSSLYWLLEHGTYSLGYERMLMELYFRRGRPNPLGSIATLWENPAEGYNYWLRRFNEWRQAANASRVHFIKKQCPQILASDDPATAYLATLWRLADELPQELFDDELQRAKIASVHNALQSKNRARWGQPGLDTWLLEIWPLVTEYGWNYRDVRSAAVAKFDQGETPDAIALDVVSKIEDRCKKMLGLRLSKNGQAKQGRPKEDGPAIALLDLALRCDSLGSTEQEWVLGNFRNMRKVEAPAAAIPKRN